MTVTEQLSALGNILAHGDLSSLFQPIVSLSEQRILGYEALTRGPSNSPLHSPINLFAVARQAGRLTDLEVAYNFTKALNLAVGAVAGLLLGMGLMQLARTTPGSSRAVVFNRVFVALGLAVWIQGADYLWAWLVLGEPSFNSTGVFNGKVQVSYLANLFLSLCMAEAFSRVCGGGRYVAVSSPLLAAWALCAVAVTFFSGARNGLIGVVLLCVSTGLLMLYYAPSRIRPWQRLGGFALLLCVAAGLAGAQLKTDTRWARFIESTSYSFQTDTVLSWLDPKRYPYPILSDGQPLDDSAYERTAWIIVGMKLSAEHKLGVGFTRKAYTNTVMDKYGVLVRHSHSGLVEYTLGMGWPGIALWAAFLLTVFSQGLRRLLRKHDTLALASMFLVSGFAGRMIIENVTRDHMMEMFMFLIGLMLAALVRPAQAR